MRKRSESLSARTNTHLTNSLSASSLNESLLSYKWNPLDERSCNGNGNGKNSNSKDSDGGDDDNDNGHNSEMSRGSDSSHDSNIMFNFDGFLDESLTSSIPLSELISLDFGTSFGADLLGGRMRPTTRPCFTTMEQQLDLDLIGSSMDQRFSNESGIPFSGGTDHDCYREAHEILGSLLLSDSNCDGRRSSLEAVSPRGRASAFCSRSGSVTLDQLLLINGKAVERLSSLLACPCAGSSHLMMLYVSTISAILSRYQNAAGSASCMPCPTWDSLSLQHASSCAKGTNNDAQLGGPMVSPARISIGAFSVDDPKLQSAMNIRLLASEVTRVAGLIDQIASYHSGGYLGGGSSGGQTDGMYQSFATWLRSEHSRVTDAIRNKLRELEGHLEQNCAYLGTTLASF